MFLQSLKNARGSRTGSRRLPKILLSTLRSHGSFPSRSEVMETRSEGLRLRHCNTDRVQEDTKPLGNCAFAVRSDNWSRITVSRQPFDVLSGSAQ